MFCWKSIGSILKTVFVTTAIFFTARAPLFFFYRNRENMTSLWRHLRPTYQSLRKFLWSGYVKLMPGGVCKVWWWYIISFIAMGGKVEGGGGEGRSPIGARVNPRSAGGKYYLRPYFLNSSKTTADIGAKLSVHYLTSIWRLLSFFSSEKSVKFLRKWCLVTSCSTILGQKASNVWRLLESTVLK